MKKITILLFSVATLLAGCSKENAPERRYVPDIKFSRTGEVVLEASIENAMAKATMNTIGEARWERNDEIAVVCTDGTLVSLKLDGTGDTRKAFFKGVIPEGKVMGDYAFYPVSAIKSFDGKNLKFDMPEDITSTTGKCPVMVAKITEGDFKIEMKQLFANMVFRIHNVKNTSRSVQITSDVALSGPVEIEMDKCFTDGVPAVKTTGNPGITLKFGSAPEETVTFSVAVPVGLIGQLTATTFTSAGKQTASVDMLTTPCITVKAATFECEGTLPKEEKRPIPGNVLLCDIYWSMGNLQYDSSVTTEGFRSGWGLASNQWHYFNYDIGPAYNDKSIEYNGTVQRADVPVTRNAYDHFNWGGIEDNFSFEKGFSTKAEGGFTMSGKMYTDIELKTETTDFASAKYGDIAFWASNGQFRMPTEAELRTLFEKADAQFGYVLIKDDKGVPVKVLGIDLKVWGWLFTAPSNPRKVITTEREITALELTDGTGLFLPMGGRKANSSDVQAINTRPQGVYWSGTTATTEGEYQQGLYSVSLNLLSSEMKFGYEHGTAYDRKSGFLIRPVYIPKE